MYSSSFPCDLFLVICLFLAHVNPASKQTTVDFAIQKKAIQLLMVPVSHTRKRHFLPLADVTQQNFRVIWYGQTTSAHHRIHGWDYLVLSFT